jgi:hypothetical protein
MQNFTGNKKALFVTSRVPEPLNDGWKIRTFHLMQGYVRNGWELDLISFCAPGQSIKDFPNLQSMCSNIQLVCRFKSYALSDVLRGLVLSKPFNVHNFHLQSMFDAVKSMVEKHPYDLIQVEDVIMAQYLDKNMGNVYQILDMHNVESSLMSRYADKENNLPKRIYARMTA